MRGTWTFDKNLRDWIKGEHPERGEVYPAKLPGHKLTLTWSGEHGYESSSTAVCSCGWSESASSQRECRWEYRDHLKSVYAKAKVAQ